MADAIIQALNAAYLWVASTTWSGVDHGLRLPGGVTIASTRHDPAAHLRQPLVRVSLPAVCALRTHGLSRPVADVYGVKWGILRIRISVLRGYTDVYMRYPGINIAKSCEILQ